MQGVRQKESDYCLWVVNKGIHESANQQYLIKNNCQEKMCNRQGVYSFGLRARLWWITFMVNFVVCMFYFYVFTICECMHVCRWLACFLDCCSILWVTINPCLLQAGWLSVLPARLKSWFLGLTCYGKEENLTLLCVRTYSYLCVHTTFSRKEKQLDQHDRRFRGSACSSVEATRPTHSKFESLKSRRWKFSK